MEHNTELVFSGYLFAVIGEEFFSTSHHLYKRAVELGKHGKNATADCSGDRPVLTEIPCLFRGPNGTDGEPVFVPGTDRD